jgi:exonuclease VII large subunit
MVKGAAMGTVLLLRQCPPGAAENYAVAVRDMNAALLEKQQELLARAKQAPLKLPPPLPQPNARNFPTSRKRKMTGLKAALQEEVDAAVRRRREAIQAQDDDDYRRRYLKQSVKDIIERQSQRDEPLPNYQPLLTSPSPSASPNVLSPASMSSSSKVSPSLSSSGDNSGDDSENGGGGKTENRRPRRGVRRSRKLVENSQTRKDIAASKAPKRRKPGKKALQAAAEMSQLLDGYIPPPSSAVILNS